MVSKYESFDKVMLEAGRDIRYKAMSYCYLLCLLVALTVVQFFVSFQIGEPLLSVTGILTFMAIVPVTHITYERLGRWYRYLNRPSIETAIWFNDNYNCKEDD